MVPSWPKPTRTDSHAALVYPRPFGGISTLHGLPVPSNTEEYLRSLFGYLGHFAAYDEATGLYVKSVHSESFAQKVVSFLSSQLYKLLRDPYFIVIMAPVHEDTRDFIEERMQGAVHFLEWVICGGSPFRDCFASSKHGDNSENQRTTNQNTEL